MEYVIANVDTVADGQGDYVTTKVEGRAKFMVRASNNSSTSEFRLYITYGLLNDWRLADSETVHQTCWRSLETGYVIADEAVLPAMRAQGLPFEFALISGIKVTVDDGTGERPLLTVMCNDPQDLHLSMVDGEFENPNTPPFILTVESQLEWKQDIRQPEDEDLILYTVGEPGTVPLNGQTIPDDFALAGNKNDNNGAYEVWRFKRCSQSWGKVVEFIDFPASRLFGDPIGNDDNFAAAILVRSAEGRIDAISDASYEHTVP